MQLTSFQRKTLENWRRMKPHGLTWTIGLQTLVPKWAVLTVLGAGVYVVAPRVSLFVACVIAGAILRDLGYVRSARRVWPVSLAVIDWAKVDALLESRKGAQ